MAGPGAGPALLRVGTWLTVAGLLLGAVALLPLVSGVELSSVFWGLAMLLGVGIGVVLVGLLLQGRRRSRVQRAATAPGTARPTG